MTCPSCKREYAGTPHCACGYAFAMPQPETPAVFDSIDTTLKSIKNILTWFFWLSIVAIAAALAVWFLKL